MNTISGSEFLNVLDTKDVKYVKDSDCSVATVYCPTCKAGVGRKCRNKAGKVMARAHSDRNQRMFRLSQQVEDEVLVGFVQSAALNGDSVAMGRGVKALLGDTECTVDAWILGYGTTTVLARFRDGSRRVLQVYPSEFRFTH